MSKKTFDKHIKDHLLQETETATNIKEETWNNIENRLFHDKKEAKRTGASRWFMAAGIVAMVFFIAIASSTDIVQAMIQNIKSLFVEEKQQEIEIEGHKEKQNIQLEVNEELRYVIYIDDERYKMEIGDTSDRIVPAQELGEQFPEVSMEIRKINNTSREAEIEKIKQEMDGLILREEENIHEPIEAVRIRAIAEGESTWDTPVYKWYITPTKEEQVFIIKQSYFLEAAEGHGARFDQMLESFEIVNE